MRDDVRELVRAERVVEAARLARDQGDLGTACELFERGCEWADAASAALLVGDAGKALRLAATGDATATADAALARLSSASDRSTLVRVADDLRQRALFAWAARTYEAAQATESAALAWERAGDRVRAAGLLEATGDGQGAMRAARVLEVGLRREPDRADLLLALGALLLRCGKAAAALRALQRVPDDAAEKVPALNLSLRALTELGMADARADVVASLRARGESPEEGAPRTERPVAATVVARLYGRYEVIREVSSTATARLLECTDVLRGERVAVKLFSLLATAMRGSGRDALEHFAREARVLARLSHPNIVPLHEVLEQGPALVLEWMPGGTLEDLLAREAPTPARAVDVACAVLGALGEAHRRGVVHRDLKPANILFDASGTARLSDFGVAHLGDLSVTATAGSFGSFAYMSPEQREGRPATAQSDLYGVGVILHEMLTGRRPAAHSTVSGADVSLGGVHRYLDARHDAALAALVAHDPSQRPQDAFAAQRTLTALPWPADHDAARAAAPRLKKTSAHPPPLRLQLVAPDGAHDAWLDRRVSCVPLTPRTLERAARFARAGHPALQPVLRVDREASTIWLGAPRGEVPTRGLESDELAILERALARLHRDGFVHGSIGPGSVRHGGGAPQLLFPTEENPVATMDHDRAALADLRAAPASSRRR